MRILWKLLCAGLLGLFLLFLIRQGDDRLEKDRIMERVRENRQLILACVESGDYSALDWLSEEDISIEEDHVNFCCGGAGMGAETIYRGFFYSESGDLLAIWSGPAHDRTLTPYENGYQWLEEGGDNGYYVEEICDGFYYYAYWY